MCWVYNDMHMIYKYYVLTNDVNCLHKRQMKLIKLDFNAPQLHELLCYY